ncbi:methyltransferase domain-containing protein [Rhizobium helianthi]|uniref:Methyltransferase domain-containing protein n=1 Tax=Rhizobium helianthi TaxID=1132695 RepID=A0ABW4M592_9HYPH
MSGFDLSWLALREPADAAARDRQIVRQVAELLDADVSPPVIVDIGCGTGSTYRALSPVLSRSAKWRLVDHDENLLATARQLVNQSEVEFLSLDLRDLSALPLKDASLVTASAFFDLASASFCERLAQDVASNGAVFYAALNYNGLFEFATAHSLDEAVIRDFNAHQCGDKGFGPALGPQASGHLEGAFRSLGYDTLSAQSPWVLGTGEAELQAALLKGMVDPVREIGRIEAAELQQWLDFRLAHLSGSESCVVGHTDLLAWPS